MYIVTGYNAYSGIVETVEAKSAKDALKKIMKEHSISGSIMKLTTQKNLELLDKGIQPYTMIQFTVENEDSFHSPASMSNYLIQ